MIKMNDIPAELQRALSAYNKYVEGRIKTIAEFDVWFDQTHPGKDFPRDWYKLVNGKYSQ